jgi:SAM-dependent methyltransferase
LKSKELFPSIFSRHAAAYQQRLDGIMARGEARGRQRVIEFLDVGPGMRVLDLACGPGTLTRPLAARVAPDGEVVGVDLAAGMIELARAGRIPNAKFEVMDIERLEFADASFDAAACGHGLQFVPDLRRALREAHRVLHPGARFGASLPVDGDGDRPWRLLFEVVDRWLPPAPSPPDRERTQATVNDADALRAAAVETGFVEASVEVIEEQVRWESAEQLVGRCMSWWDLAARLDGVAASKREQFAQDAIATLRSEYPGAVDTTGRNNLLLAVK